MSSYTPPRSRGLELLAPTLAELLHHLAQAHELLVVAVLEALLHEPAQRGVEVAVVEQVVAHLGEQLIGVEIEAGLACRPSASSGIRAHPVAPAEGHEPTLPARGKSIRGRLDSRSTRDPDNNAFMSRRASSRSRRSAWSASAARRRGRRHRTPQLGARSPEAERIVLRSRREVRQVLGTLTGKDRFTRQIELVQPMADHAPKDIKADTELFLNALAARGRRRHVGGDEQEDRAGDQQREPARGRRLRVLQAAGRLRRRVSSPSSDVLASLNQPFPG